MTLLEETFLLLEDSLTLLEETFLLLEDSLTLLEETFLLLEDSLTLLEETFLLLEDSLTLLEDILLSLEFSSSTTSMFEASSTAPLEESPSPQATRPIKARNDTIVQIFCFFIFSPSIYK